MHPFYYVGYERGFGFSLRVRIQQRKGFGGVVKRRRAGCQTTSRTATLPSPSTLASADTLDLLETLAVPPIPFARATLAAVDALAHGYPAHHFAHQDSLAAVAPRGYFEAHHMGMHTREGRCAAHPVHLRVSDRRVLGASHPWVCTPAILRYRDRLRHVSANIARRFTSQSRGCTLETPAIVQVRLPSNLALEAQRVPAHSKRPRCTSPANPLRARASPSPPSTVAPANTSRRIASLRTRDARARPTSPHALPASHALRVPVLPCIEEDHEDERRIALCAACVRGMREDGRCSSLCASPILRRAPHAAEPRPGMRGAGWVLLTRSALLHTLFLQGVPPAAACPTATRHAAFTCGRPRTHCWEE
ncbi:hypothetical protein DFH09DRAFT_1342573 [Mycena vulgaris]|nr:hypothetical protein DFH09DRAFT_1342573 [Mycena vulgaris]